MQKVLPHNAPPELRGHHAATMGFLALAGLPTVALVGWLLVDSEAASRFALPVASVALVAFVLVATWRWNSARCPACGNKMRFQRQVYVVGDKAVFGRHFCEPWGVMCCARCDKQYRIRSADGEDGSLSISEAEYTALVEQGPTPYCNAASNQTLDQTADKIQRSGESIVRR